MFDIGWSEMMLIAVVAIVVVGPKDLPRLMRSVGQWVRKARAMASDFHSSIDEMAREAELEEVKKSIHHVTNFDARQELENTINPPDGFADPPIKDEVASVAEPSIEKKTSNKKGSSKT